MEAVIPAGTKGETQLFLLSVRGILQPGRGIL